MPEQPTPPVWAVLPARRGGLFRKYVIIFVALVSGVLLASGLVEAYFVYTENQAAVIRLQRDRAVAIASTIEQSLRETEHLLGWVALSSPTVSQVPEQRRLDFERLLQLAPSIQEVTYFDATGTAQVRVDRDARNEVARRRGRSPSSRGFSEARTRGISFGAVRFRDGAAPVLPIALRRAGTRLGRRRGAAVPRAGLGCRRRYGPERIRTRLPRRCSRDSSSPTPISASSVRGSTSRRRSRFARCGPARSLGGSSSAAPRLSNRSRPRSWSCRSTTRPTPGSTATPVTGSSPTRSSSPRLDRLRGPAPRLAFATFANRSQDGAPVAPGPGAGSCWPACSWCAGCWCRSARCKLALPASGKVT